MGSCIITVNHSWKSCKTRIFSKEEQLKEAQSQEERQNKQTEKLKELEASGSRAIGHAKQSPGPS